MPEIPEDHYCDLDENEKPEPKIPEMPGLRKLSEDTRPYIAEAGAEQLSEIDEEAQPLVTKEKNFKEEEPENEKNIQLEPTWTFEEEISKETQMDLFIQAKPGIPQVLKSETLGEMEGKLYKDLTVSLDEKGKEPDLEPPEKAKPDITEWATETDTQLPVETKSEVSGATTSETRLELLLGETEQKAAEESIRKYEETDLEPSEQTKPDFASGKSRKSIEEVDLQLSKMTKPEIPEETQNKSTKEKKIESLGQTKLQFSDQKPKILVEKTDLQPPEEIKPEVPEKMQRKSTKEIGRPMHIKQEFPGWKTRKSTEEKVPEPLESEFSEQQSGKPIVETSLEPSEKTSSELPKETRSSDEEKIPGTPAETELVQLQEIKPDVEEETRTKSTEPLEYTKPIDQKEKQRKSSEKIGLALPEKLELEKTLKNSAKEKGLEPSEQTELELPNIEPRKTTEEASQVPLQMTESVQDKRQTESTEEKNLELLNEAKSRETRKFVKETDKIRNNGALESHRGSKVDSKLLELNFNEYSDLHFSESQMELKESFNEKKIVDLSEELEERVPKDEECRPQKVRKPQFEFLKWSPEQVAEWISQLGFPQYKECFTANFIGGNKLIHVNCSNLPQMGITDFEHMKVISRHTRELLGIEEPLFKRSITLPYRDNIGLFLEQKSHTGVKSDSLTFSEFVKAAGLQDYAP